MRSIAILNQKGGVGKTTTSVNLSAALADAGRRVCLIDMDPQAHASLHLGQIVGPDEESIYHVLTDERPLAAVRRRLSDRLSLVPAQLDLAAAEMELVNEMGRETILRDRLREEAEEFDYLILDCPPSLGVLTLNALTAAKEIFLPLQPHFLALHGLSKLLRTVQLVAKRLNKELRLTGVVLCLYETGARLAAEVKGDVGAFFDQQQAEGGVWSEARLFETTIRRNIRLAEAPSFGQSIFEYAPASHGAEDYRELAREVLAQEGAGESAPSLLLPCRAAA